MDLKRFFCENKIIGNKIILSGEEFYHAIKVTRHKVGYKIIVCDNGDIDYYATITEINKDNLVAIIDKKEQNFCESNLDVTLFIGNNKNIDSVVQKAVELGIKQIVPFTSQHCNVFDVNYERLRKIIVESSKQCGRSRLAHIEKLKTFEECIQLSKGSEIFAFYEHEIQHKVEPNSVENVSNISIFIGCEGGFSEEEINVFKNNGIYPYTLGKRILRVSTAVVAACTLINNKFEKL